MKHKHSTSVRRAPRCLTGLLGLALLSPAYAAPQKPAYGTVKPYTLSVQALQDVAGRTDVQMTVNVVASGFTAPAFASHIQLKSFDTAGNLRWTQNTKDAALTAVPGFSTTIQSYADMLRGQPVNAFVQVNNSQTVNQENLRAAGPVKLRPDIKVDSITAPARVAVGQVVNIGALLKELNGDLGATTDVKLFEGATELDNANGVAVLPLGSSTAVFSTRFTVTGLHTLIVKAANVNPGDYDLSNNTSTFAIEVANSIQPARFHGSYQSERNWDYLSTYSTPYSNESVSLTGSREGFQVELYGIPMESGVLDKVSVDFGGDGALNPALHYELNNLPVGSWRQVDLRTYMYAYSGGGTVGVYHWDGDYVYFSEYHDYHWGYTYTYTEAYHDLLTSPTSSFDARVVVTSGGQQFGGSLSVPLQSYPYSQSWDYSGNYYGDYHSFGHSSFTYVYGDAYGVTAP